MNDNILVVTIKYIFIEVLWDIIYFPMWWYTKGTARIGRYCLESAQVQIKRRLALGVWISNIFKPMYGDYTIEGRIISGFMRLVVLVWKLIQMIVWLCFLVVLFLAWLILPVVIVFFILYQLWGVNIFFEKM
jgi:hypothetical protein